MKITKEPFGALKDGTAVTRYTMVNENGMAVSVLDYGGTVQRILVPDGKGGCVDVALGYDSAEGYEAGTCFFGSFVGRYANRIKGAAFELNGQVYHMEKNDGENHLHGTFCRTMFDVEEQEDGLVLSHTFPDGEEGCPGSLAVRACYRLTEDNALEFEYFAETDADTVINLTNHTYFNLDGCGDVLGQELTLFADRFTEGGEGTIPTGNVLPVEGTPMDFREGKKIGKDIASDYAQLTACRGYDHNYVLNDSMDGIRGGKLTLFASAGSEQNGICMDCYTTQPAVQLYTGNFVDKDEAPYGKNGVRYPRHAGFCLETQNYPCAPNYPQFPNAVLRAGETYHQTTQYRFSVKK